MDILIDSQKNGKTIKALLREEMGYSSGMLKKLKFSPGGILVNGEFKTVRYELREGDILSIACEDKDEDVSPYIIPSDISIGIAYEDSFVTVVDKPSNMPAHPSHGHRLDTVANALAFRYNNEPYVFRPVNRLDRDTSGLMITANNRLSAFKLYKSMINGKIKKLYIAVLDGHPENDEGCIKTYVCRCEDSIVKRRVCKAEDADAKEAVTLYKTICKNDRYTVVVASPITGRTHQLRLHFSHIGCPITGDTMYGNESTVISRHALHAFYLSFPHPETNNTVSCTADLPEDMRALIDDTEYEAVKNIIDNGAENILDYDKTQ